MNIPVMAAVPGSTPTSLECSYAKVGTASPCRAGDAERLPASTAERYSCLKLLEGAASEHKTSL